MMVKTEMSEQDVGHWRGKQKTALTVHLDFKSSRKGSQSVSQDARANTCLLPVQPQCPAVLFLQNRSKTCENNEHKTLMFEVEPCIPPAIQLFGSVLERQNEEQQQQRQQQEQQHTNNNNANTTKYTKTK